MAKAYTPSHPDGLDGSGDTVVTSQRQSPVAPPSEGLTTFGKKVLGRGSAVATYGIWSVIGLACWAVPALILGGILFGIGQLIAAAFFGPILPIPNAF